MPVQITYIGPSAEGVTISETGDFVTPGQTFEVDADVAGSAPKGKPEDNDYDPGVGLLAQPENFVRATTKAAKQAEKRSDA